MNKHVIACGFSILAFVAVGCASEVEDERVAESTADLTRGAASWECGQGDGLYCGQHGVFGSSRALFRCSNGRVGLVGYCTGACLRMPDGQNDACQSSIGGGEGPAQAACPSGNGLYCGGNGIAGQTNMLYSCSDGAVSIVRKCANGCRRMPAGYNDQCN